MINELAELLAGLTEHTALGHAKRDDAFLRQVRCLSLHPGGTGSGSCTDLAATASAYRFANNEEVELSQLRRSRRDAALAACPAGEPILVINDVSILDYSQHNSKADRRAIGDHRGMGYEYVCNLGVCLSSGRHLGVLHDSVISSARPDDADEIAYHADERFASLSQTDPTRLESNHKHILNCHFAHIAKAAPGHPLILVADREFDDYFIFAGCRTQQQDFVIRSNATRNVQVAADLGWLPPEAHTGYADGLPLLEAHVCATMKALVDHVPLTPFKTIPLDGKGRLTDEKSARSRVQVSAGAFAVTLYRNAMRNRICFTPRDYVHLNVVVVKETAPPEGREPIQWVLYTSLPVGTEAQLQQVVRIYEMRWLIECFFKYLKSGFQLEELRYDSARKTAIHLVAMTIAATFLINLKGDLALPRAATLSPTDHARVKHALKNLNDPSIDPNLRSFALFAKQGGWLGRKNDPISPLTLMRGFSQVVAALDMLANAADLLQHLADQLESTKNA